MLQNYSRYRILQEFFTFPKREFHMREIARMTNIAQPSVLNHLKALVQEGFITREKKGLYPTYRANRDSESFKVHKKSDILVKLHQLGIIDHIYDSCMPDVIVLFGSTAKGEDTEESDIDLFVLCKEKKLDLEQYEKQLHRKINIFFSEDFNALSKELRNNIIEGVVLKGHLKVF